MKIIYLASSVLPSKQANGIHVMRMCDALFDENVDVTLVCKAYNPQEHSQHYLHSSYGTNKPFQIIRNKILKHRGGSFWALPAIYKLLKKENKNTIIYARDIYGAYIAKILGFKVIFEFHGLPVNKVNKFIERILLNDKKNYFVYISKALERIHKRHHDFDGFKSIVLHDGANINLKKEKEQFKGEGDFKVGYIGSLYKGRGIEIILECAKTLKDIDFYIVGGDLEQINNLREDKSENVFFTGFVPPCDVPSYLNSLDVLLMPYQSGLEIAGRKIDTSTWMSPMKLFEYMSARKAIISSDLPVLREVLNENNSILVPPNSVNEWINAISRLKEDELFRNRISQFAYDDLVKFYTWNIRAKKIKNIAQEMNNAEK